MKKEEYTAEEKRVIDFFFTLYKEMARRVDVQNTRQSAVFLKIKKGLHESIDHEQNSCENKFIKKEQ